MTIYIIKNSCIYDNINHELKSKDGTRAIKLTHMRSKCLDFILTNAQELVIRKNQISAVLWEERSEFINDANLTQLLYLVRKDLKFFGIDNLFVTIPRQGIQLNGDIEIKCLENKQHIFQNRFIYPITIALIALIILYAVLNFYLS
ncbi:MULTISPECIES: winged helix-turn-helix domain-containing protein [unclassified Citrobacter]|uniref:winged helix-turn-helix domain-containing protein n=2 Tax=Citrobacter TaxID=544 RepID=UPI00107B7F28|nr:MULTISPECIES: transcriptional regulator [unclassified Citrobacter]MDA8500815.1 transcriptional regulator [Citrobacter sp. Igbk 17]MDA8505356.1 transcriptional regulator [Citrobacter sp. Awk 2]MDA8516632.1 transcriptional regulator [Citrobacter sp. Igbk 16]MEB2418932.1 transcriptional regulator [Citrobacter sp. R-1.5.2]